MNITDNLDDEYLSLISDEAEREIPMSDEELAKILEPEIEPEVSFIRYNDDEEYDSLIDDQRPDDYEELDFNE